MCDNLDKMCLWFSQWNDRERDQFIRLVLLPKVVPHKLFAQCSTLCLGPEKLTDVSCNSLFQQQVAVFESVFAGWDVTTRNTFCHQLEEIDPIAMNRFGDLIAQTVGEP